VNFPIVADQDRRWRCCSACSTQPRFATAPQLGQTDREGACSSSRPRSGLS
jgi:hypothetical protein